MFLKRERHLDRFVRAGHYRLGAPRDWAISADGNRIAYLRTRTGGSYNLCLWLYEVDSRTEHLVADAKALEAAGAESTWEEEQLRKMLRHGDFGITQFATDRQLSVATFTVQGRLGIADLARRDVVMRADIDGVFDPRPSPDGKHVAFVDSGSLRLLSMDSDKITTLVSPEDEYVAYGVPEFVAAEEMGRFHGYWWSPDGSSLLVARVDNSRVDRWYLANPLSPEEKPREVPYPACGSLNSDVSLWLVGLDGSRKEIVWDQDEFEYLLAVRWPGERASIVVQDRSQRRVQLMNVDLESGKAELVEEYSDDVWVSVVPGVPAITGSGKVVCAKDLDDTTRLLVDGRPISPPGLNVRSVVSISDESVVFLATSEPRELHVWEWTARDGVLRSVTDEAGIWNACSVGGTTVISGNVLGRNRVDAQVARNGSRVGSIRSTVEELVVEPNVTMLDIGPRELRVAVVLPSERTVDDGPFPVLVDSYGGPDGQRVMYVQDKYAVQQWFAEHGFAVVVADGRGTRGRSPSWSRSVRGDVASRMLQDQVEALHGAADQLGCLDLSKVGIRGYSFAGYLTIVAVLRRPDVFHSAIARGAPTDMRLYNTYWMERYLGNPTLDAEPYERCSLVNEAANLSRPLMLIHGMFDDNVLMAHSLRMSAELVAHGRPHELLVLPSDHNIVAQPAVEKTMYNAEVGFLRRTLGLE